MHLQTVCMQMLTTNLLTSCTHAIAFVKVYTCKAIEVDKWSWAKYCQNAHIYIIYTHVHKGTVRQHTLMKNIAYHRFDVWLLCYSS